MEALRKEWPGDFPGKVYLKKDECTFTQRQRVGHMRCAQRCRDMEGTLSFMPLIFPDSSRSLLYTCYYICILQMRKKEAQVTPFAQGHTSKK